MSWDAQKSKLVALPCLYVPGVTQGFARLSQHKPRQAGICRTDDEGNIFGFQSAEIVWFLLKTRKNVKMLSIY